MVIGDTLTPEGEAQWLRLKTHMEWCDLCTGVHFFSASGSDPGVPGTVGRYLPGESHFKKRLETLKSKMDKLANRPHKNPS